MSSPPVPTRRRGRRPLHQRIGFAALIVGAGVLISRILGLLRDVAFAWVLGADAVTDEYVMAFAIPDWINYLLAGGYLAITFIPIFSRYLAEGDEDGGWRAFAAIAKPLAVLMTVIVAVGMVAAQPIIKLLAPDFTPEQVERTVYLTRIVLPAQVLFVLGALLMAVQYAKERFVIPTLAPIIYNLFIIVFGVAFNLGDTPRPEGFAWGVLFGSLVGNFLLQWWGAYQSGLRIVTGTKVSDPVFREYLGLAIPLMVGQSLVLLDEQIGRTIGTFAEDGGISWLQFARRTMLVPVGVIAQAAAVAAYPYLARLFAEHKLSEMAATVARALRYVLVLSMAAAAGLVALSIPIIRVLYERGEWDAADTVGAAGALVFFGLGVPIWGAQQILARGFYARREMWTPVLIGTSATIAALPIYWLLFQAYDVRGIALASTVALTLYTLVLGWFWYRRTGWDQLFPVLGSVARALPLAVGGGVVAWGVSEGVLGLMSDAGWFAAAFAVLGGAAAFFVVVFAIGGVGDALTRAPAEPEPAPAPPAPDPEPAAAEPEPVPEGPEPLSAEQAAPAPEPTPAPRAAPETPQMDEELGWDELLSLYDEDV